MILIHQTRELTYADDDGELDSTGDMRLTDYPMTFRELVRMLENENYIYPSCYPATGGRFEWVSTQPEEDYRTGTHTTYSLHFAQKNHPRKDKYWRKALTAVGIIK
jgi:hypothetical protein